MITGPGIKRALALFTNFFLCNSWEGIAGKKKKKNNAHVFRWGRFFFWFRTSWWKTGGGWRVYSSVDFSPVTFIQRAPAAARPQEGHRGCARTHTPAPSVKESPVWVGTRNFCCLCKTDTSGGRAGQAGRRSSNQDVPFPPLSGNTFLPLPPLSAKKARDGLEGESRWRWVTGLESGGDWANLSLVALPQHVTLPASTGLSFILNKKVYRSV